MFLTPYNIAKHIIFQNNGISTPKGKFNGMFTPGCGGKRKNPQYAVSCQKMPIIFSIKLSGTPVVPGENLCYNDKKYALRSNP